MLPGQNSYDEVALICDRHRWHAAETSTLARHCPCAPHPTPHCPTTFLRQGAPHPGASSLLPAVSCVPSGFRRPGSQCLQGPGRMSPESQSGGTNVAVRSEPVPCPQRHAGPDPQP